jgi:O-antigen ligase
VTLLRVAGLAGAALFLGYLAFGGSLARHASRATEIPLALFVVLLLAASFASVDPAQSFRGEPYQYQGVVTVSLYIGAFYLARLFLGSRAGFRALLIATTVTGALVAAYAIAQGLGLDPFWSGAPELRSISSVGQSNDLAAYLDFVVISAVGLSVDVERRVRIALAAVIVVALIALAMTLSRGGYLGLAVGLLVLAPGYRRPSWRHLSAAGVIAVAVLAVILVMPPSRAVLDHVAHRIVVTVRLRDGSMGRHADLWRLGAQVALDHPLLGTGPETFPLVAPAYLDSVLRPDRADLLRPYRLESPHNELIGIAAEVGLPALGAYVALLAACAVAFVRRAAAGDPGSRSVALVVLAILVSHVVTTSFKTPEISTNSIFWIAMGAGLAATDFARRH